jgi:protein SCO1/2
VDPKNDTPEVLRRYQEKFGVQDSNWYFLTGKFGAIKHLIGGGFKLGTPESPELHTGKFVLVDGSAQIRGYYDSTAEGSIDKLKTDIKRVLSEQL